MQTIQQCTNKATNMFYIVENPIYVSGERPVAVVQPIVQEQEEDEEEGEDVDDDDGHDDDDDDDDDNENNAMEEDDNEDDDDIINILILIRDRIDALINRIMLQQ